MRFNATKAILKALLLPWILGVKTPCPFKPNPMISFDFQVLRISGRYDKFQQVFEATLRLHNPSYGRIWAELRTIVLDNDRRFLLAHRLRDLSRLYRHRMPLQACRDYLELLLCVAEQPTLPVKSLFFALRLVGG